MLTLIMSFGIKSEPSSVIAHRGIDSIKLTLLMIVTMSAGRAVAVTADSPELVMIVLTAPCATVKSAVMMSMP